MTTIELFTVTLRVGQVTLFFSSPSVSMRKSESRDGCTTTPRR